MRCIGIIGVFVVLLTLSANAADASKPCYGLLEEKAKMEDAVAQAEHPLMTDDECEAAKRHGLNMRLFAIPQEDEDPMGLSVGSKDKGGMLYFKIPFSF